MSKTYLLNTDKLSGIAQGLRFAIEQFDQFLTKDVILTMILKQYEDVNNELKERGKVKIPTILDVFELASKGVSTNV